MESKFQRELIAELEELFPGCIVLKNDPNFRQGILDLVILHGDRWAALEAKDDRNSKRRPNQQYYLERMDQMSYAAMVYPENKEEILNELQHALEPRRRARNIKP